MSVCLSCHPLASQPLPDWQIRLAFLWRIYAGPQTPPSTAPSSGTPWTRSWWWRAVDEGTEQEVRVAKMIVHESYGRCVNLFKTNLWYVNYFAKSKELWGWHCYHIGLFGQIWDKRLRQKYNCLYQFCLWMFHKTNGTNQKVFPQGFISVTKKYFFILYAHKIISIFLCIF